MLHESRPLWRSPNDERRHWSGDRRSRESARRWILPRPESRRTTIHNQTDQTYPHNLVLLPLVQSATVHLLAVEGITWAAFSALQHANKGTHKKRHYSTPCQRPFTTKWISRISLGTTNSGSTITRVRVEIGSRSLRASSGMGTMSLGVRAAA